MYQTIRILSNLLNLKIILFFYYKIHSILTYIIYIRMLRKNINEVTVICYARKIAPFIVLFNVF